VASGKKKREIGAHTACNDHCRLLRHDLTQKLSEIFHMITGVDGLGRPLRFSKTDKIGSYDFMVSSSSGIDF